MMYQKYHTNIPFPNECDEMPEFCDGIIFGYVFDFGWDTNRRERFRSVKTRTEGDCKLIGGFNAL